jgi:hypothetical protein
MAFVVSWPALPLVALAVVYLVLIHRASRKESQPRELSEAELLAKFARIGPHSEYGLFLLAAKQWRISRQQVEADFRTYLLEESIPYYVNSYLRKRSQEEGNHFRPPFTAGGGSLPWLK